MQDETTGTSGTEDVLLVTTLDRAAYGAYDRAATALGASTPALLRHVVGGLAPVLSEAAERLTGAPAPRAAWPSAMAGHTLHLSATVLCGDMIVGSETRCALSPRAVQAHEEAVATLAWTRDLLARARATCALAQTVIAEAHAGA